MENIKLLKLENELSGSVNENLYYRKKINDLIAEGRRLTKGNQCMFCGKEVNSFCNSHSLPAFCLKNISHIGEVYSVNILIGFSVSDVDKGVKQAGTFRCICRECDSKIFSEYENPENYKSKLTSKMIAQIAMKNYLRQIGKKIEEIGLYKTALKDIGVNNNLLQHQLRITENDMQEYKGKFKKAKRIVNKGWENEYYLFYSKKLDYVTPVAFQGLVTLITDLQGNIVNNIYNMDTGYHIQDLHICVFPLKDTTQIILFVDSESKRYRKFIKEFNRLEITQQLAIINYIIFLYSEDVFISKKIPQNIIDDEELVSVSKQTYYAMAVPGTNVIEEVIKEYDLNKSNKIPNLLSEEFKI